MLLPVYLTTLGFSPFEVGVQAGTALLGSALLTLAMSFLGVRYDHRLLLTSAAGFGFPVHTDYEGSDRHPLRCVSESTKIVYGGCMRNIAAGGLGGSYGFHAQIVFDGICFMPTLRRYREGRRRIIVANAGAIDA